MSLQFTLYHFDSFNNETKFSIDRLLIPRYLVREHFFFFWIHLIYFKANPILHAMRVPLAHRCMPINQDKAEISDTHLLAL